jgi:hypothetical protein
LHFVVVVTRLFVHYWKNMALPQRSLLRNGVKDSVSLCISQRKPKSL